MKIEAALTVESFNRLFEDQLPYTDTIKAAYEKAEEWHEIKFGVPKYNSYLTFASARSRYMKNCNMNVNKVNNN